MTLRHNVLLDTSALIDLPRISSTQVATAVGCDVAELRPAISAVTLAELAAGPHATQEPTIRAARQARLQWAEATFVPLPFDAEAARAYGVIYASVLAVGRTPRKRLADLLIAAVAAANSLPLVTRNPDDFAGIESDVAVISV